MNLDEMITKDFNTYDLVCAILVVSLINSFGILAILIVLLVNGVIL